jgi:hypothetical protein
MGKKTAPSRTRPRASSSQTSGLIAKAQSPPRSAGHKPALDDHSHRTGPCHRVSRSRSLRDSTSVPMLPPSRGPVGTKAAVRRPEPEAQLFYACGVRPSAPLGSYAACIRQSRPLLVSSPAGAAAKAAIGRGAGGGHSQIPLSLPAAMAENVQTLPARLSEPRSPERT